MKLTYILQYSLIKPVCKCFYRLVSGSGEIKITKDGNVLLHEMVSFTRFYSNANANYLISVKQQIQHPTASLIARASTAQDDVTGDGTTSTVLVIGELLKQADLYVSEGLHPRIVTEGFEMGKNKALEVLESVKIPLESNIRDSLLHVARTSLRTKVHQSLADLLTDACVDAVLTIKETGSYHVYA